jgi:hypothetical protein
MAILPRLFQTKLRTGERAFVQPGLRRQPGLKRWRTYDAVSNGSNGANGHGQVKSLSITEIADQIVSELASCNIVCVGPTVRGDAPTTPPFYCALCSSDDSGFFSLVVGAADLDDAVQTRVAIRDRLREMGKVVMVFQREIEMAREVSQLWPGPATAAVLATVEAGR